MTDDAVIADDGVIHRRGVEHTVVLDAGPCPDPDRAVVAAQHRTGPDGRIGPDLDIPDHDSLRVDIGSGVDPWNTVAERIDGHRRTVPEHRRATPFNGAPVAGLIRTAP